MKAILIQDNLSQENRRHELWKWRWRCCYL